MTTESIKPAMYQCIVRLRIDPQVLVFEASEWEVCVNSDGKLTHLRIGTSDGERLAYVDPTDVIAFIVTPMEEGEN